MYTETDFRAALQSYGCWGVGVQPRRADVAAVLGGLPVRAINVIDFDRLVIFLHRPFAVTEIDVLLAGLRPSNAPFVRAWLAEGNLQVDLHWHHPDINDTLREPS